MDNAPAPNILIDQATGVIMGHFRCDVSTATDLLRLAADGTSEPEMARRLVHVTDRSTVLQWIAERRRET